MKKQIILLLIVLTAVLSISAVSAGLFGGKTIQLNGVEFNIPDGFKEVNPNEYNLQTPMEYYQKCYENDKDDFVAVSVSKSGGYSQQDITNAINSGKFTAKSINGYNGAFQITSGGYGCAFLYLKGDKIAIVYASDESFLSQLAK